MVNRMGSAALVVKSAFCLATYWCLQNTGIQWKSLIIFIICFSPIRYDNVEYIWTHLLLRIFVKNINFIHRSELVCIYRSWAGSQELEQCHIDDQTNMCYFVPGGVLK